MTDAIVRTLYRKLISHRKLLECETAAQAEGAAAHDLKAFLLMMWPADLLAFAAELLSSFLKPTSLREVGPFVGGLAAAKLGGKVGYIDKKGEWIVPPKFAEGLEFGKEGLASVATGGLEKYLTLSGAVAFESPGSGGQDFNEGLAPVTQRGHVGYLDSRGRIVIPARFDAGPE